MPRRPRSNGGLGMGGTTSEFLQRLGERGQEPALRRTSGSLRIDLDRDGSREHWRVEIDRGAVSVSRSNDPADTVLAASGALFDDLTSGRANAMASYLRNELHVEGDPALLVHLQRLFPAPTGPRRKSARMVGKRRG